METAAEETPKDNAGSAQPEKNVTLEETPPPQDPPAQEAPKKSKSSDRPKKDDKNVEQFMKSLNSLPTAEEKLAQVCKKYVQTADDNKKLQFYIKQSDKRFALLLKEKEQLQHEFNKTILVKSKLENLCRELQKQNKAIKEESLVKIREEEERRKETQAKFQNTLTEITTLLQQNNEKNAKLRDDNISMTEKFKSVAQQYQLREQQVEKMAKQMALESQLSDAKLQKAALEHQAEKERILAEMEQLKVTLAQYRTKIMELQGTETALKGQLSVYTDKYDEFQNALVRSNQMFGGFKDQMEKMSKKIQKLEKESLSWKNRWETSQAALIEMCGERQSSEERAAAASRHLQQMQSLCRTLQAERSVLLSTLKENNIERPPLPALPPAPPALPPPPPASNAKVDAMAANCAQLRQSLAHLQSQLNTLTNKNAAKEEPPKPEKSKKSKSKKNKAEKLAQKALEKTEPEVKEPESDDSHTKSNSEESQPSVSEVKVQNEGTESPEDKIDSKTMESLIQAINLANINICDLDVVNDNENTGVVVEEIVETNDVKDKVTNVQNETNVEIDSNKTVNTVEATVNETTEAVNESKPETVTNEIVSTPVEIESNNKLVIENNLNAQSSPKKETTVKSAVKPEKVKEVAVNGEKEETLVIEQNLQNEKPKEETVVSSES